MEGCPDGPGPCEGPTETRLFSLFFSSAPFRVHFLTFFFFGWFMYPSLSPAYRTKKRTWLARELHGAANVICQADREHRFVYQPGTVRFLNLRSVSFRMSNTTIFAFVNNQCKKLITECAIYSLRHRYLSRVR